MSKLDIEPRASHMGAFDGFNKGQFPRTPAGIGICDRVSQNPNTFLRSGRLPRTARYRRQEHGAIFFLFCHLLQEPNCGLHHR